MPLAAQFNQKVVVKSRLDGKTAFYDVYSTGENPTLLKTTRFSELDRLRNALAKEAPRFKGQLPAKTMTHSTNSTFVENRRVEIQQFLQAALGDDAVLTAKSCKEFFKDVPIPATTIEEESIQASESTEPEASEAPDTPEAPASLIASQLSGSEISLDGGVHAELKAQLHAKLEAQQKAMTVKEDIEKEISRGNLAVDEAKEKAHLLAETEVEEEALCVVHKERLERMMRDLQDKIVLRCDREAEQNSAIARLEMEMTTASKATKECRARFEAARRARLEAASAARATAEKCEEDLTAALAASSSAVDFHTSMKASMDALRVTINVRVSEAALAEVEREARVSSVVALEGERSQADAQCKEAEATLKSSIAALNAHAEDSERRARAYGCEQARTEERARDVQVLQGLETRGKILGRDRQALAVTEENVHITASAALEAAAAAKQRREDAERKDAETKEQLQGDVDQAAKKHKQREHILKSIEGRLEEAKNLRNKAIRAHACSSSGLHTLQKEFDQVKLRVEGELAREVERSAAAVKAAEETLVAARTAVVDSAQRAEDVEQRCLERQEQTESNLARALDTARVTASEAKFYAEIGSISSNPNEGQVVEQLEKLDVLVSSTKANVVDRQRQRKEVEIAYQQAVGVLEAAQVRLDELYEDYEEGGDEDKVEESRGDGAEVGGGASSGVQIAALEAEISDLTQLVQYWEAERMAAISQSQAAAEELQRVTDDWKNAPRPTFSLERLLQTELDAVSGCIDGHQQRKVDLQADVTRKETTWRDESSRLSTKLHSATLQLRVAEEQVKAVTHLQRTVRSTKST